MFLRYTLQRGRPPNKIPQRRQVFYSLTRRSKTFYVVIYARGRLFAALMMPSVLFVPDTNLANLTNQRRVDQWGRHRVRMGKL